uniref:ADAM metallopeptidase domain 12 n=1 Tax=Amphiprion percula TaxID=161767 RepID=A0A3P8TWS7_AMPPE
MLPFPENCSKVLPLNILSLLSSLPLLFISCFITFHSHLICCFFFYLCHLPSTFSAKSFSSYFLSAHFSSQHKRHVQTTTKYVELIIVADNREVTRKLKLHLSSYLLHCQFYRALNIRVALVGLEVWSDVDKCPITQDPFTTLHEFLDWRKVKLLPQKPHDNAQLISGVYFQGTTIGMAPIMSMCTAEQSGGIVMDHSDNPLGAAVTLAHELGHNFGMNHDTPERGCGCRVTVDLLSSTSCLLSLPGNNKIVDYLKVF